MDICSRLREELRTVEEQRKRQLSRKIDELQSKLADEIVQVKERHSRQRQLVEETAERGGRQESNQVIYIHIHLTFKY